MFKQSASPEDFEKRLNTQDNHVNNLDLNNDGEIDYVRVIDKKQQDVHAIVLQVPVSAKESQDIAVIELEKTGDASAVIQIVGDKDIFGEETIVEPQGEGGDPADEDDSGKGGPRYEGLTASAPGYVVVNVWAWPAVRFVYAPAYRVWVSPWRWHSYPVWWHPWHSLAWRVFHPFRLGFRAGFVVAPRVRVAAAHRFYARGRVTSVTVRTRYRGPVGHYRVTRTTTVRTKHGAVKRTTRTRVGRRR
jgi:hypothetical protein